MRYYCVPKYDSAEFLAWFSSSGRRWPHCSIFQAMPPWNAEHHIPITNHVAATRHVDTFYYRGWCYDRNINDNESLRVKRTLWEAVRASRQRNKEYAAVFYYLKSKWGIRIRPHWRHTFSCYTYEYPPHLLLPLKEKLKDLKKVPLYALMEGKDKGHW